MINVELTEHEYYILNVILGHLDPNNHTWSLLEKFKMELDCEDYDKLKFREYSERFTVFKFSEEAVNADEEPEECVVKSSPPLTLSELQRQLIEALSYAVKTQDNESVESLSKAIQRIK